MRLRRLLLLALALLLASVALDARAQVCTPDAPLRRTLAVNVLDKQGNLVRGLTAADFRGEFRGHPVKILSLTRTTGSRRIVILLDVSGSMTGSQRKMKLGLTAAEDAAVYSSAETRLGLLIFAEKVVDKVDFSEGRSTVAAKLAAIKAGKEPPYDVKGGTALIDTLVEATRMLGTGKSGDAVYVITDGGDSASRTRYRDMEGGLLVAGVRFYAFALYDPIAQRSMPEYLWGPNWLLDSARNTGGAFVGVGDIPRSDDELQALGAVTRRVYEQMAEFYGVEAELAQAVDKPRDWKLEVVNADGKRRKDVEVVYPRKLVPCAAASPAAPTSPSP